jgi:light-regulated signal transduction histidine kinase (bacteriophytochrome)
LVKQAKRIGILYLENRLADGVFTAEKAQMTELLTSQAAISLENARLVEMVVALGAQNALAYENIMLVDELRHRTGLLEQTNKDLQDFAFVVSHDLQEPLRKVISFGEILKTDFTDVLGDQGNAFLSKMVRSASRMQDLINGLLNLSKVATQHVSTTFADLGSVLREVLADLEVMIQESGGTVDIGDLPTVKADEAQMRQLYQNLIANALKFRKADVPPVVRVDAVFPVDGFCEVVVRDNGIGFDMKDADCIFRPFMRLHRQENYEGTGMGLSICERIVQRNGGEITVESEIGKGTTFKVRLPVYQV